MTPKEIQEALARLASGEVASMKDLDIQSSSFGDEISALWRITEVLNVSVQQAGGVYQSMITHLQDSDLTINFKSIDFFKTSKTGPGFSNTFERGGGDAGYMKSRDKAEENLFDYSNTKGRSGVGGVINRVRNLGSFAAGSNQSFEPAIRPKYAALNFANLKNGAAPLYGRSYMVLKEHVKHNCTFTDKDSFAYKDAADGADAVANYFHLQRLIVRMSDKKLKTLYHSANGTPLATGSDKSYIEAQLHGGIQFNRDVKKIYIDMQGTLGDKTIKENFTSFAKKNGIQLECI